MCTSYTAQESIHMYRLQQENAKYRKINTIGETMNDEKMEQINAIFTYGDKIKIVYGFYKDRTGIVKKVFTKTNIIKGKPSLIENWYEIEIIINDRKLILELNELMLEKKKAYRPFPFNLMR